VISPARVAAFHVLEAVSAGRADLPSALAALRGSLPDDRDQALASEIAVGVQRHRAALDYLLAACSKRPLARLDPEVVDILRLGAYQLLHLTRVPASAVVDDAVELARLAGKASAAGFVNAVLRALSRRRGSLELPPRPADPRDRDAALAYLAVTLSHPRWLVTRWSDRFGFDATERWLQFDNSAAPLTLRVNRLKLSREALVERLRASGVGVSPGRFAPDALLVEHGRPLRGPGVEEGWFVVQDEASQLVSLLAGPSPGTRVLDACASPGGKATAIAATIGRAGHVVACDVRPRRVGLLRKTVAASGATNIHVVRADATRPLPFHVSFDCVLVDAPCSGLGTLRRDPDIRWRRREQDLPGLAALQLHLLRHAAEAVAPGGRLIYATCSSEPEENEQVIESFLEASPGFERIDIRTIPGVPPEVADAGGFLRTLPHVHGLEAFFGAVLERRPMEGP
jgi:16S rRNA (cytosine967-C5)-methyltransferase